MSGFKNNKIPKKTVRFSVRPRSPQTLMGNYRPKDRWRCCFIPQEDNMNSRGSLVYKQANSVCSIKPIDWTKRFRSEILGLWAVFLVRFSIWESVYRQMAADSDTPKLSLEFRASSEKSSRWGGAGRKHNSSLSSWRNGELCAEEDSAFVSFQSSVGQSSKKRETDRHRSHLYTLTMTFCSWEVKQITYFEKD